MGFLVGIWASRFASLASRCSLQPRPFTSFMVGASAAIALAAWRKHKTQKTL